MMSFSSFFIKKSTKHQYWSSFWTVTRRPGKLPSHSPLYDLPSTQQGRNSLRWCGGTFLRSGRGSSARSGSRGSQRGSARHSCQRRRVGHSGQGRALTETTKRCWYSQSPGVPRRTDALSCHVDAGSSVETLAGQLTGFAIVTVLAGLLAAPPLVPVSADAGPCDGVTLRPVLALTPVAAVRSPEVAVAAWRHRKNRENIHQDVHANLLTHTLHQDTQTWAISTPIWPILFIFVYIQYHMTYVNVVLSCILWHCNYFPCRPLLSTNPREAQNRMADILCLSAVELNCHPKTIKNTSVHLDSLWKHPQLFGISIWNYKYT